MNKKNTVKKNEDFKKIIKNGSFFKTEYFIIYKLNSNLDHYRFGISVSKKNGSAVKRNRLKRQLREIIKKYEKLYKNKDYIIIIRKEIEKFNFNKW